MTTAYTSLLGLALPVTGELSGTWGDTVNDYITKYMDAAVAGAQTISGTQTAVTLSVTNGTSLSQVGGSGSTGSAQYQIINCTGNPAGLLTITAPAASKVYLVLNATSTSQSVKVVGSGPTTGVTIISGEKALIAWNGSDFVKIATAGGSGTFYDVTVTNSATLSYGTANGVLYLNGSKVATSGSSFVYDSSGNLGVGGNPLYGAAGDRSVTAIGSSSASFFVNETGVGAIAQLGAYNGTAYIGTRNNYPFYFTVNGSEVGRWTSTGLGIGTSSPGAKLGVSATYSSDTGVQERFYDNTGTALNFGGTSGGKKFIQAQDSAGAALYYDILLNPSGGNVGIGTSSPYNRLESVSTRNTALGSIAAFATMPLTVTDDTAYAVGVGGGINFRAKLSSSVYSNYAAIWSYRESANVSDYRGSLVFGTTDNTNGYPIERARIDSAGNLGIGTSSPSYKLDLTSSNDGYGRQWISTVGYPSSADGSAGFQIRNLGGGTAGVKIANYANTVEWLRIDSSGNLGIGTSSPGAKLHVVGSSGSGDVQIGTSSGANQYQYITFGGSTGGTDYGWQVGRSSNSSGLGGDGAFYFYDIKANATRMSIDSSGNLGLGVTPSGWGSNWKSLQIGAYSSIANSAASGYTMVGNNTYASANNTWNYSSTNPASMYLQALDGTHRWYTAASGTAGNAITFTQAATLTADGVFLIGKTSPSTTTVGAELQPNASAGYIAGFTSDGQRAVIANRLTSDGDLYSMRRSGTEVGTISVTTTATAYNTSSDYRLKDNQQPLTGSGAFIDALKPKTWTWKADGSAGVGFIAHEVQEVSPSSVVGEKDGEKMQAMEYGSAEFIANIIAELQSLRKRVAQLEGK